MCLLLRGDHKLSKVKAEPIMRLPGRIEELQTQLNAAHSAQAKQEGSSGVAAGVELHGDASQPIAVQLKAQLAVLQRQLKASQVLPPWVPCMWVMQK